MKDYHWNLIAFGLTLGAWLVARLCNWLLPKSWDSAPFYIGLLIYLLAYVALGWAIIRAIWHTFTGSQAWGKTLLVAGISIVQGVAMLFVFILLLAEGFRNYKG